VSAVRDDEREERRGLPRGRLDEKQGRRPDAERHE
jgi:hypothetical protein